MTTTTEKTPGMADHEKRICEALEAGPTEGTWITDSANPNLVATDSDPYKYICEVEPSAFSESDHSDEQDCINATYIAACNPAAIRALLAELDAVRVKAARYDWLRNSSQICGSMTGRGIAMPSYETSDAQRIYLDECIDAAINGAAHD